MHNEGQGLDVSEVLANESGHLVPEVSFSKENCVRLMAEHDPLYKRHVAEVGWFKQDQPEMMWSDYLRLEHVGILRIFVARSASGEMVGYALYFVRPNLHYAKTIIAQCDMIYIEPKYRGGTGEKFIEFIDGSLKREGVHAVTHHAKVYYDFGSMLKRQEYEHIENIYVRRLN